jgi:CRP-like cAMP-binding protein
MRSRIPKRELEMLSRVPLFSACSQTELRQIARLGTELDVEAGRVLTDEGAPGREFFLVVEGKADCRVRGRSVAVFGPGDYFGELALLDGGRRTATVKATTPMRLTVLSVPEFAGLVRSSPTISTKLLSHLARRLRETQAAVTN